MHYIIADVYYRT